MAPEARAGRRRIAAEIDAPRATLVGVTYHDPDGRPAYCYNSEVASMRLTSGTAPRAGAPAGPCATSSSRAGRAHFEFGQRDSVTDVDLLLT